MESAKVCEGSDTAKRDESVGLTLNTSREVTRQGASSRGRGIRGKKVRVIVVVY